MQTALAIQSWTLYAVGLTLICSRIMTLGCFKKAQADDWLMVLVLLPYTASIVLANQIPDEIQSPQSRKYRYVLEEMQIITMWLVKACLLILYWRIFPTESQLWKRRTLQSLTALCCISFLVVQISLLASCHSINTDWDLTASNTQCTSYQTHASLALALSLLTTIAIFLLPIPFIPTPRRLLQLLMLLLGTLILIAGIISRSSILTIDSTTTNTRSTTAYLPWYTAESSLTLLFANLPFLTTLLATTAPARRIRQFSTTHSLSMSQWPRSRRTSLDIFSTRTSCSGTAPPSRWGSVKKPLSSSFGSSNAAFAPGSPQALMHDDNALGKALFDKAYTTKFTELRRNRTDSGAGAGCGGAVSPTRRMSREEEQGGDDGVSVPMPASPSSRLSCVTKMRLSGGLAEMGDGGEEGWPLQWK